MKFFQILTPNLKNKSLSEPDSTVMGEVTEGQTLFKNNKNPKASHGYKTITFKRVLAKFSDVF